MHIQGNTLFEERVDTSNPRWIVKQYFDDMYGSGNYVEALLHLTMRRGFGNDDAVCRFPDMGSYFEEDHFEGVEFCVWLPLPEPYEIIISQVEFCEWLTEASARYVAKHPSESALIAEALRRLER